MYTTVHGEPFKDYSSYCKLLYVPHRREHNVWSLFIYRILVLNSYSSLYKVHRLAF